MHTSALLSYKLSTLELLRTQEVHREVCGTTRYEAQLGTSNNSQLILKNSEVLISLNNAYHLVDYFLYKMFKKL